ncbi:MAG: TIGR04283 family arsenosugar biosynthesis glycosyltransferase [Bacteroidetes bacterium]|nr:TIGR04283 family arsenosugar biosynthesis glycosyltransferase [Bacteroidota bacterium]
MGFKRIELVQISVIIPTYNEEERIGLLLDYLKNNIGGSNVEIIVVDGGSTDSTIQIARNRKVITENINIKLRAQQLNYGASIAKGDIFYFVHADTFPPSSFIQCIKNSVLNGYTSGCCAYNFDSKKFFLKVNGFFTKYNGFYTGGGDQTLFVTKSIFFKAGGFNSEYVIMEDFEFTKRLKKISRFKILKNKAIVSARKYDRNSYARVNFANTIALFMFWVGMHPKKIQTTYKNLIK